MFFLSTTISIFSILFSVMFITLLERKILSYSQVRLGPNKISIVGILQPLLDGMKLIIKEKMILSFTNKISYVIGPSTFIILMLLIWITLPNLNNLFSFPLSIIFLLSCIGVGVYIILISGWISNSKFSIVGSIRSMSQTISYEINLAILIFCFFSMYSNMNLNSILKSKMPLIIIIFLPLCIILYLSIIAELNRAPFDFSEGESELVSGFNTEFLSSNFAVLFIGEYGMIIFFSIFLLIILCPLIFYFLWLLILAILISSFILIRSVFPRFRYDKLMHLSWFKLLPVSSMFMFLGIWIFFI